MPSIKDSISLLGDKELEKKLKRLPEQVAKKVLRPGISAGLTPVKNALTKNIRNSVKNGGQFKTGKAVKKYRKDNGIFGMVGVKKMSERKFKLKGREVPFNVVLNILEFGSQKMNIKPKGFMRRARAESKSAAMSRVVAKTREKLKTIK